MSVVSATLKNINERKTMSHEYNPTPQEMRDSYSVAYGDLGDTMLIGALFGYLKATKPDVIENLYQVTISEVRNDLVEKGLI